MDGPGKSLVRYTEISKARKAAFLALDYSSSMKDVATSVVAGYEQCRRVWAKRIPDALFLPTGFHHKSFSLIDYETTNADNPPTAVTTLNLPRIKKNDYIQRLRGGSRLIDVFEVGLTLTFNRLVQAIFIMTDGWENRSIGTEYMKEKGLYRALREDMIPEARRLGCVIKILFYLNPRKEKQMFEFIKLCGLQEGEFIIYRPKEQQEPVDQLMVGLQEEVLKIHGETN